MDLKSFSPLPGGLSPDAQLDLAKSTIEWWKVKLTQQSHPSTAASWANSLLNELFPLKAAPLDADGKRRMAEHLASFLVSLSPPSKGTLISDPELLHPCLRTAASCSFGQRCRFAKLPRSSCIFHLKGNCRNGDHCRDKHLPTMSDSSCSQSPRPTTRKELQAAFDKHISIQTEADFRSKLSKWWEQRPPALRNPTSKTAWVNIILNEFSDMKKLLVRPEVKKYFAESLCRWLSRKDTPVNTRSPVSQPHTVFKRSRECDVDDRAADLPPEDVPFSCPECHKPFDNWQECLAHIRRRLHVPEGLTLQNIADEAVLSTRCRGRPPRKRPLPDGLAARDEAEDFLARLFGSPPPRDGGPDPIVVSDEDREVSRPNPPKPDAATFLATTSAPTSSSIAETGGLATTAVSAAPVSLASLMRFCPECGGSLPPVTPGTRFCLHCGTSLKAYLS